MRSNRALPDPFVPPNTLEDETITTARPGATAADSDTPADAVAEQRAEDSTSTATGPLPGSAPAGTGVDAHPDNNGGNHHGHTRQQSIMGQWVDEIIGRGNAAGVRVPTADEIAQLTSMFPDAPRERILLALQRRCVLLVLVRRSEFC